MTSDRSRPRVVLAIPVPEAALSFAREHFDTLACGEKALTIGEALDAASSFAADAVVFALGLRWDAAAIGALPDSCRVLATATVGFDHVDLSAAGRRGVAVTNTPDVLTDATADLAMLLMLAVARRLREHMRNMDAGWAVRNGFSSSLGIDLASRTLGIVGMGRIGRALARRARGFGMRIVYHNRTRLEESLEGDARWYGDLDEMLPHCQALSLNLPGGQGVVMDRRRFSLLPDGAIFVNTARGSLVDEGALIEALQSGRLFGAGLDVFQAEPDFDKRLIACPNVALSPHVGSATEETRTSMALRALINVRDHLSGAQARDRLV
jgi:hydroxypyruvate reductase